MVRLAPREGRPPAACRRPIRHEGDEAPARAGWRGKCLVEKVRNGLDYGKVRALVAATDIVGLSHAAPGEDELKGTCMVLDMEPVADILATAVNRDRKFMFLFLDLLFV